MSLIPCPECSREVSSQAPHCPQCGYPLWPVVPPPIPQHPSPSPENGNERNSVSERPRKRWYYYGACSFTFYFLVGVINEILKKMEVFPADSKVLMVFLMYPAFIAAFVMFTLGSFARLKQLPPGPARRPKYIITALLGFVSLLMTFGLIGGIWDYVSPPPQAPRPFNGPVRVLRSTDDGLVQIQLPEDWRPSEFLRQHVPIAHLAVSDPSGEINLTITSVPKSDLSQPSLRQVTSLNREQLVSGLAEPVLSEFEDLQVAGFPALRFEAVGTLQEQRVAYLQTIVETPSRFFVISVFTRPSLVDSVRSQVATAVASFSPSDR